MTLRQKQSLFISLVARLIDFAVAEGYELTFGEAWRSKDTAEMYAKAGKGISNSLHCQRLAIDLNLFKDGKYLAASEDHRPLGEFWKTLNELCCWGGDFVRRPDGNHYSLRHGRRR